MADNSSLPLPDDNSTDSSDNSDSCSLDDNSFIIDKDDFRQIGQNTGLTACFLTLSLILFLWNTKLYWKQKTILFAVNAAQSFFACVAIATDLVNVTGFVSLQGCYAYLFFCQASQAFCVSLCQCVSLLRLYAVVSNKWIALAQIPLIVGHTIFFIYTYMSLTPYLDPLVGSCCTDDVFVSTVIYLVVFEFCELYQTLAFVYSMILHARKSGKAAGESNLAYYRNLMDDGIFASAFITVANAVVWALLFTDDFGYFAVIYDASFLVPSYVTTYMCYNVSQFKKKRSKSVRAQAVQSMTINTRTDM